MPEGAKDATVKVIMHRIATDYDRLAEQPVNSNLVAKLALPP
jgi:hypothetical protein